VTNRLASSTSPYLLQHKDNPVDWWPWSPAAFRGGAAARRAGAALDRYAACHWCHVMAHESFEDDTIAAYMNEHFVNIKVDREERPDVDAVYMEATQAMTGHGGWPMTCVLTPKGEPFFCGTYFPDRPRLGSPSFPQVLESIVGRLAWPAGGDRPSGCRRGGAPQTANRCAAPAGRRRRTLSIRRSAGWPPSSTQCTPASVGRRSSRRPW
jgi:uncharacterized protein YyaL (SSP411 family)